MTTTFLSTNNISLFTVPSAWLLCVAPSLLDRLIFDTTHDSSQSTSSQHPSPPAIPTSSLTPPLPPTLPLFSSAVTAANLALIIIHANEGPPASYARSLRFVNTQCLAYLGAQTLLLGCGRVWRSWGRNRRRGTAEKNGKDLWRWEWWARRQEEVLWCAGAVCGVRLWWWAGRGLRGLVK